MKYSDESMLQLITNMYIMQINYFFTLFNLHRPRLKIG